MEPFADTQFASIVKMVSLSHFDQNCYFAGKEIR